MKLLEAHRMKPPGFRPRLRIYRKRFYSGGREVEPGRTVYCWETARKRYRALTFEVVYWRFSVGVLLATEGGEGRG